MKFIELYKCLARHEHIDIDIMNNNNYYSLEYDDKKEIDITKLENMEVIKVISVMCNFDDCGLYVVLKEL